MILYSLSNSENAKISASDLSASTALYTIWVRNISTHNMLYFDIYLSIQTLDRKCFQYHFSQTEKAFSELLYNIFRIKNGMKLQVGYTPAVFFPNVFFFKKSHPQVHAYKN